MTLRDIIKKKDSIGHGHHHSNATNLPSSSGPSQDPPAPHTITLLRSDTNTQELIAPPSFSTITPTPPATASTSTLGTPARSDTGSSPPPSPRCHSHGLTSRFRSSSSASTASNVSKSDKRISQLLHLQRPSRSRASSSVSIHVPEDLPDVPSPVTTTDGTAEDREAKWEERATILALSNPETARTTTPPPPPNTLAPTIGALAALEGHDPSPSTSPKPLTDVQTDASLRNAIALHESGDLPKSTAIFSTLAHPIGANNPLAQVLYGLALRHGWGVPPDPSLAVHYLSLAASSSASIESLALRSGMKRGGAAKGELTLAIFELGNCYRHGWGVKKDPVGARTYYEVAANLGDVDACREAAWSWLEGFGGAKDKKRAAGYLRRAQELEKGEGKVGGGVGESWVWKEKYNP